MDDANARRPSPVSSVITCSAIASGVLAKVTTRVKVENLVKNGRRRFLTPVPIAPSFDALNARLEADCLKDQDRLPERQKRTIGERLLDDLSAFRHLPDGVFEACEVRPGRVSSTSLVRYRCNDYSVPTTAWSPPGHYQGLCR